jgi:hypothetical protein
MCVQLDRRLRAEPVRSALPSVGLERYVRSRDYERGIAATRLIWGDSETIKTAGSYIFLTYLTIPALTNVRSRDAAIARSARDGLRERRFLIELLGLGHPGSHGIRSAQVRELAHHVSTNHSLLPDNTVEYMSFMSGVTALAPLLTREQFGLSTSDVDATHYWTYMQHAMGLLGGQIGTVQDEESRVAAFINRHCHGEHSASPMVASFWHRHPYHSRQSLRLMHNLTRDAVEASMKGSGDPRTAAASRV